MALGSSHQIVERFEILLVLRKEYTRLPDGVRQLRCVSEFEHRGFTGCFDVVPRLSKKLDQYAVRRVFIKIDIHEILNR